jgi:flavin reductase (DIM6/NTAB) family NADH-FMN oxidoreductase RutF
MGAMTNDARNLPEMLRATMRHWVTGVTIVSAQHDGTRHGMTVNSFVSVSLDPPLVTVTLANDTRTHALVEQSGWFGVTILSGDQQELSDRFAGRIPDGGDRFHQVATIHLAGHAPLLAGGMAGLECRVVHRYPMPHSTLFVGQVEAVWHGDAESPLVYWNRVYHQLGG